MGPVLQPRGLAIVNNCSTQSHLKEFLLNTTDEYQLDFPNKLYLLPRITAINAFSNDDTPGIKAEFFPANTFTSIQCVIYYIFLQTSYFDSITGSPRVKKYDFLSYFTNIVSLDNRDVYISIYHYCLSGKQVFAVTKTDFLLFFLHKNLWFIW